MIFIGIDPGLKGAMCCLRDHNEVSIFLTPVVESRGRDQYDLAEIARILVSWCPVQSQGFVTVERAVPLPPKMPGGTIANFNRGVQRGWEWLLAGLGIPHQVVMARTWQKVMHAGLSGDDTKQKSILAAQRLYPEVDLRRTERSRKPDDGMAEALLLADYGRRTYSQ